MPASASHRLPPSEAVSEQIKRAISTGHGGHKAEHSLGPNAFALGLPLRGDLEGPKEPS